MKWLSNLFDGKDKKGTEERKYERFDFYQSSYYRIEADSEKTYECWFNNISLGGLSFDTEYSELHIDETIKILYKVETKIRYDLCTIRYKTKALNNWRYGCEFIAEDTQRDEMIKRYVEKNILAKN